jgi:hypothetical protein
MLNLGDNRRVISFEIGFLFSRFLESRVDCRHLNFHGFLWIRLLDCDLLLGTSETKGPQSGRSLKGRVTP